MKDQFLRRKRANLVMSYKPIERLVPDFEDKISIFMRNSRSLKSGSIVQKSKLFPSLLFIISYFFFFSLITAI